MTKHILVADDHGSVRRSLRTFIAQRQDWQVCAEAADGVEAVEKTRTLSPDAVVLDLAMGGLNGVEAAGQICAMCPATVVLAIRMYDAEPLFPRLQVIGVRGFVDKNQPVISARRTSKRRSWFRMEAECSRSAS